VGRVSVSTTARIRSRAGPEVHTVTRHRAKKVRSLSAYRVNTKRCSEKVSPLWAAAVGGIPASPAATIVAAASVHRRESAFTTVRFSH